MKVVRKPYLRLSAALALLPLLSLLTAGMAPVTANANGLAVIKGVVRTNGGSPIADATVAIFRAGTSTLLKQVQSASDGSFLARISPGKYTVLAVAEGFNPATLAEIEVLQSAQLTYGFKLERAGSGNTLPEKRLDRNNPKWARRAAAASRSIYQNAEGESPLDTAADTADEEDSGRRSQSVAETYFAAGEDGNYAGLNFAAFLPVTDNAEMVIAAQTGTGRNAPQRVETQVKFRPNDEHQVRLTTAFGKLGDLTVGSRTGILSQLSVQATDEWKVREGVVFVYGFDFAKFVGSGDDLSISPRLGFQYDVNSKTRLRTAFTTQTEDKDWSRAIALEDTEVVFREPVAMDDIYLENGKPVMNRSSRFEIGFERVLDNRSSIDANFFADATFSRGVGMAMAPLRNASFGLAEFTGNQRGESQGLSLVYSRRISGRLSTSAGYSLGRGQRISERGLTDHSELFENGFFQSFFGQIDADLKTGTHIKTIFRLSPEATVFAIDPFQGRLAIYDPSMSVLVTQDLPTLGLPIQAQATVDARNIFDFQTGLATDEGSLRMSGMGRTLRGSIMVRF